MLNDHEVYSFDSIGLGVILFIITFYTLTVNYLFFSEKMIGKPWLTRYIPLSFVLVSNLLKVLVWLTLLWDMANSFVFISLGMDAVLMTILLVVAFFRKHWLLSKHKRYG